MTVIATPHLSHIAQVVQIALTIGGIGLIAYLSTARLPRLRIGLLVAFLLTAGMIAKPLVQAPQVTILPCDDSGCHWYDCLPFFC